MPEFIKELEAQGVELTQGDVAIDGSFQRIRTLTSETLTGARTLTFAEIKGGLILFNLTATDRTVTLPTAALIRAGLLKRQVGSSIRFWLRNTTTTAGVNITLAGGTGVTLSPTVIIVESGESVEIELYLATTAVGSEAVTAYLVNRIESPSAGGDTIVTAANIGDDNTAPTVAQILGGYMFCIPTVNRSKAFPTGASIIADLGSSAVGTAFTFRVENKGLTGGGANTNQLTLTVPNASIVFDTVTIMIAPQKVATFLGVITSAGVVTIYSCGVAGIQGTSYLYAYVYGTAGNLSPIPAANIVDGLYLRDPNGADRTDTLDTATAILAVIPSKQVGVAFDFVVKNTSNGGFGATSENLTIAAGAGITLSPTTIQIAPGQTAAFKGVFTDVGTPALTLYLLSMTDAIPIPLKTISTSATLAADAVPTAVQMAGGLLSYNPDGADRLVTLDTAANIISNLLLAAVGYYVGASYDVKIRNTGTALNKLTVTTNTGLTLDVLSPIIWPGQTKTYRIVVTGSAAVSVFEIDSNYLQPPVSASTIADDAVAMTLANILNGISTITPTADRSKATPTALVIIAGLQLQKIGASFDFVVRNAATAGNFSLTITGGVDVTLDPTGVIVRPGQESHFRGTLTSATALTIYRLESNNTGLPVFPGSLVDDTAILTAAQIASGYVDITPTVDRSKATDSAANIIAALPIAQVGQSHDFTIRNLATVNATLTITAGATVTLNPTTILVKPGQVQNFKVVLTSATAVTILTVAARQGLRTEIASFALPDVIEASAAASTLVTNATVTVSPMSNAIAAQPDYPRNVKAWFTVGDSGITDGTLAVVGTDILGQTQTENLVFTPGAPMGTQSIVGTKIFASLVGDQVFTTSGAVGTTAKIALGIGAHMGLPCGAGRAVAAVKEVLAGVAQTIGTLSAANGTYLPTGTPDGAKALEVWYTVLGN